MYLCATMCICALLLFVINEANHQDNFQFGVFSGIKFS